MFGILNFLPARFPSENSGNILYLNANTKKIINNDFTTLGIDNFTLSEKNKFISNVKKKKSSK